MQSVAVCFLSWRYNDPLSEVSVPSFPELVVYRRREQITVNSVLKKKQRKKMKKCGTSSHHVPITPVFDNMSVN